MLITTNANYIFDQLTDLLDHLNDDQYVATPEIFSGASVGKHYRHIIEFFQSVSVADETETICYDNRLRDERIENNRALAKELLQDLKILQTLTCSRRFFGNIIMLLSMLSITWLSSRWE